MSTATVRASVELLDRWRESLGMDHTTFAAHLGRHKTEWSMVRLGKRRPSLGFMSHAIARAPEPWKSALKQARQADLEAADAALAVA